MERSFIDAVRENAVVALADQLVADPELAFAADDDGKTALHWAAELNHEESARLLLDAGADLEARTAWGATPLEWAATIGATRVGNLLLARGAIGPTLAEAAGLGKLDVVSEMLDAGIEPDPDPPRPASPLVPPTPEAPDTDWPIDTARVMGDPISDAMYLAARNGHRLVVELLLDHGAATDAKGYFGGTALHWAAINGHRDTVALLVERGASLEIRDARFDATPEEWASDGGHDELGELLRPRQTA